MKCIDCDGAVTVFSLGKPHERGHCHNCGARPERDQGIPKHRGPVFGNSRRANVQKT